MTAGRAALLLIGVAFVAAEVTRPTAFHDKKIASRALLPTSQHGAALRAATLDPELLDDLPRIWPNAPANVRVRAVGTQLAITGRIADPYTGSPGAAVFPIIDGRRVAHFSASYGGPRYAIELNCGGGRSARRPAELAIGMVAADQRGYFHSTATVAIPACTVLRPT